MFAPEADRMTRTQCANRAYRLRDDDMIVAMQINVKPIGAGAAVDVPVAEIQAEEIAIVVEAAPRDRVVIRPEGW